MHVTSPSRVLRLLAEGMHVACITAIFSYCLRFSHELRPVNTDTSTNLCCSCFRLDKPVSGLLLLARSTQAAGRMRKLLEVCGY
jgi:23S rRNA-/tRNA-specific pseudouridylate synthase